MTASKARRTLRLPQLPRRYGEIPGRECVLQPRKRLCRDGDADRAIADYTATIRLDPAHANAYYNRGNSYSSKGDTERAIADYSATIRLDPGYANAYYNRGNAYRNKGNTDRAIADYTEAVRLQPANANAYFNRGNAYGRKGETERAIADYTEAIRADSTYANAYLNRGLAYEKRGDFARARADFNATLGLTIPPRDGLWTSTGAACRPAFAAASNDLGGDRRRSAGHGARCCEHDRRIALVIGNSAYENVAALPNPVRDASLVADVLKLTGFEAVTLLTDLRKDALVNALREFAARAETADWAVVYYAGHGMEVGGINYLIPTDAKIAADREIAFEAVPVDQVLNAAERARKLRLVILDACRDNPFAAQMKRTMTVASRSVSRGPGPCRAGGGHAGGLCRQGWRDRARRRWEQQSVRNRLREKRSDAGPRGPQAVRLRSRRRHGSDRPQAKAVQLRLDLRPAGLLFRGRQVIS